LPTLNRVAIRRTYPGEAPDAGVIGAGTQKAQETGATIEQPAG
jgi:hypothetical protein